MCFCRACPGRCPSLPSFASMAPRFARGCFAHHTGFCAKFPSALLANRLCPCSSFFRSIFSGVLMTSPPHILASTACPSFFVRCPMRRPSSFALIAWPSGRHCLCRMGLSSFSVRKKATPRCRRVSRLSANNGAWLLLAWRALGRNGHPSSWVPESRHNSCVSHRKTCPQLMCLHFVKRCFTIPCWYPTGNKMALWACTFSLIRLFWREPRSCSPMHSNPLSSAI